jgi:tRNA A37 threonylcarbamoyladenosine dehydratase
MVSLSSLNRHAVATRADVGTPKVLAMKRHLLQIVPHAQIDAINQLFDLKHAPELLHGDPAFVLDCIDNLETKAQLIAYCGQNNIRIIASMGAGAKADPSRIQIADINETIEDALSKKTRKALRELGFNGKVPCVYSTEKPGKIGLQELAKEKVEEADQYAPLPNFRSRILPVLGTIPALFGNAMASYVLTELAGFPTGNPYAKTIDPIPFKATKKQGERFWKDLYVKESKLSGLKNNEYAL